MFPVSKLIGDHPKLVSKLRRFSFQDSAELVGTLGILPELFENTIRIETLTHLVAACCHGNAIPTPNDLGEWIGKLMDDSPLARQEDPAEDVFVSCVHSPFGTFRIFQGIFGDGAFIAERLLGFYAEKQTFPSFKKTLENALALLRLSESLANKAGLQRYCAGGGAASQRIRLPRWKILQPKVECVRFSEEELEHLGISKKALEVFILTDAMRITLDGETMWGSILERHPLVAIGDGIVILQPSTLARTVVRYLAEGMLIMGGWAETFYEKETAETFVNTVRSRLDIDWFEDVSLPPAEAGTPSLYPALGIFDIGKPVIMLTYTPPLESSLQDFAGIDRMSEEEEQKINRYVQACAAKLETMEEFSGGLVLFCIGGYGRTGAIGLHIWSPRWRVQVCTLSDWLLLTAASGCTAMRLWKLGDHELASRRLKVEIANPAGLPNLYAFWQKYGYRLIPQQLDIGTNGLVVPGCEFALEVRLKGAQERDEHCLPSHDGSSWLRVVRHDTRSHASEADPSLIYAVSTEAYRRLIGCTLRAGTPWWVAAPDRPNRHESVSLVLQLWNCVLSWTDRLAFAAAKEWPNIGRHSVEVRMEMPDLDRWNLQQTNACNVDLSVAANADSRTLVLTIPEDFLQRFNNSKNVAERQLVAALLQGVAEIFGLQDQVEPSQRVLKEIVPNEDIRFFHLVETHEVEQLLGAENRPRPVYVADEDLTLAELGLAHLAGHSAGKINGLDKCREFLQTAVTKIWERIEQRLKGFDRRAVVTACFRALDEITRDGAHWDLATRSLFALQDEHDETLRALRDRRSQRSSANLANRIIIETAMYSSADSGGAMLTMSDHLTLLAEVQLMLTLAHHRDAIAYGFLAPEVTVHPNGEIEVDTEFYATVLSKYLSHRSDHMTRRAADDYEKNFETRGQPTSEESSKLEKQISKLNEIFEPEFEFPLEKLFEVRDLFQTFAIKSKEAGGELTEHEMRDLLCQGLDFSNEQATAFLNRLTLPIRESWDATLPPRCKKEDVYPWRFRRQLSALARPFIEISKAPRTFLISATFLDTSLAYLIGNIEAADLPERFFSSPKMHRFIGDEVNRRGHAFASQVANLYREKGFLVRLEVEMSALGAPKKEGLGDIDVLAWDVATGRILPVECKRLLPAITVREVIQRLEDFQGDEKAKDSLGRHVRRIAWLQQNLSALTKLTGIPEHEIRLLPALVTSDVVPMQFYKKMNFPTEQVLSYADLRDSFH